MRNFFSTLIFVSVITSFASAVQPLLYSPVLENPWAMTASAILIQPQQDRSVRGEIQLLPQRENIFLVENASTAKFTYQLQKNKKAPLIYIIPGTGASHTSNTSLALAERLYGLGYHVVTVASPLNWTFAVSSSVNALPGHPEQDAQDLYKILVKIHKFLRAEHGLKPVTTSLTGYSLGALESLFVKRIDDSRQQLKLSRVLLINPPVDLIYAVHKLDEMYEFGSNIPAGRKAYIVGRLADVGLDLLNSLQGPPTPLDLERILKTLGFTNRDLAYLIAGSFRTSLKDTIFASQQVHDLKILKRPATRFHRNNRYDEAGAISFADYMNHFVLPNLQKTKGSQYQIQDLNEESSLYQFAEMIKTNPQIFLAHAQDDFLLKESDLTWLQDTFGERALIFPYGGHCGNIAFPAFAEYLQHVFGK
ncbi:MAG: hypothetical protein AAGB31_12665 [Bdellovibrio sp.]